MWFERHCELGAGSVIEGLGGIGGTQSCGRYFNPDCSALPRQLVGASDFAMDSTGKKLFVATMGINYIGSCS